jgi:hypothetical protein
MRYRALYYAQVLLQDGETSEGYLNAASGDNLLSYGRAQRPEEPIDQLNSYVVYVDRPGGANIEDEIPAGGLPVHLMIYNHASGKFRYMAKNGTQLGMSDSPRFARISAPDLDEPNGCTRGINNQPPPCATREKPEVGGIVRLSFEEADKYFFLAPSENRQIAQIETRENRGSGFEDAALVRFWPVLSTSIPNAFSPSTQCADGLLLLTDVGACVVPSVDRLHRECDDDMQRYDCDQIWDQDEFRSQSGRPVKAFCEKYSRTCAEMCKEPGYRSGAVGRQFCDPKRRECSEDEDCRKKEQCFGGRCREGCKSDVECGVGQACRDTCLQVCDVDDECPKGYNCVGDGYCVKELRKKSDLALWLGIGGGVLALLVIMGLVYYYYTKPKK